MKIKDLEKIVINSLEELKAVDIKILDVNQLTSITDKMIIASGTSARHVSSLTSKLIENVKKHGVNPLGSEGEEQGEWCLIDLGDIIVHIMQPAIRQYYQLEKLWSVENKHISRSV